jgi:hypothetical protein
MKVLLFIAALTVAAGLNVNTQTQWAATCQGAGQLDGGPAQMLDSGYFCDGGNNSCYDTGYDAGPFYYDAGGPYPCAQTFALVDAGLINSIPISIAGTYGISWTGVVIADAGTGAGGLLQLQTSNDGVNFTTASVNGTTVPNLTVALGANSAATYAFDVPALSSQQARVTWYGDGGGIGWVYGRFFGKQLP